ncbi:SOS response-associated peptidase [Aerococcaceae bacterium DSM 111022]|nr:SOS response-associated peptidase [Aerococcaceae bacterium DSM 111022]MBG9989392.1 SOS response-associated peptidase [Aerococcaceae bacterium DSM 111176]
MCGRIEYLLELSDLIDYYDLPDEEEFLTDVSASEEVFPTQSLLTLTANKKIIPMNWGLRASWTKQRIINTRLETAEVKQLSAQAFETRRCIIPVSGFYEWDENKQKHIIYQDDKVMSLAGVYNLVQNIEGQAEPVFSVLTKDSYDKMQQIHNRVPVILPQGFSERYLDHQTPIIALKKSLMQFKMPLNIDRVS